MLKKLNTLKYQDYPENIENINRDLNHYMNNIPTCAIQDYWVNILKDAGFKIKSVLFKSKLANYSFKYKTNFTTELKSFNDKTILENIIQDICKEVNRCWIIFTCKDVDYVIYSCNGGLITDCKNLPIVPEDKTPKVKI